MGNPQDEVVRATFLDGRAKILTCVTTGLVNTLQIRHHTWPVATAALGRTASIAAMMARQLKNEERLTIRIKGDGPIGQITVDADSEGNIRGYVENPFVDLPANEKGKLDVGGGVGQGVLYITRDMGLKDYYTGSSELQTGEIADDFTYYFVVSEQTPSAVGAGVLVDTDNSVICAGGFLIQFMPDHSEKDILYTESLLSQIGSVTDLLQSGIGAEEFLFEIVPEAKILDKTNVQFRCTCSRDRLEDVLKTLGMDEIQSLLEEQDQAELICHFCNEKYLFSASDLVRMVAELKDASHS